MNFIFRTLLLAALTMTLTACGDKAKDAATAGKPVVEASAMVDSACSGNFTPQKTLADACTAEKKQFGPDFITGANCAELQKAFKTIDEMKRAKPGSCSPKIRF